MTDDKLIERVRKLLSKAERAGTEAEAEVYTAKATELMMKYSIDEAVLQAAGGAKEEKVVVRTVEVKGYAKAKLELLRAVARGLGCDAAFYSNDRRSGWSTGRAEVVGWESDMDAFEVLFASLQMQAASEAKRELARIKREWPALREARDEWVGEFYAAANDGDTGWERYSSGRAGSMTYSERREARQAWMAEHPEPEDPGREMPHGRAFMQSFLIGYARVIQSRLSQQRAAAVKHADEERHGAALAVRDRGQAVKAVTDKRWTYGGSRQGASSSSNSGYYSGRAAGERANIGSASVGGGRRAIGGGR